MGQPSALAGALWLGRFLIPRGSRRALRARRAAPGLAAETRLGAALSARAREPAHRSRPNRAHNVARSLPRAIAPADSGAHLAVGAA